jgi:hypothetical protein
MTLNLWIISPLLMRVDTDMFSEFTILSSWSTSEPSPTSFELHDLHFHVEFYAHNMACLAHFHTIMFPCPPSEAYALDIILT